MPSLNSIMSIALSGLQSSQGALDVTSNNIANSSTTGYTREVVNLSESGPVTQNGVSYGTGVTLNGYTSVRDEVLQLQIYRQQSQTSYSEAQANALEQAQAPFADTTNNISTNITSFFNDLSAMSTDPSNSALRQTVLSDAQNIANSFHSTASSLSSLSSSLDQTVAPTVSQINQLTSQIANLNAQIQSAGANGQNTSTLEDSRTQLVSQLSQLTNVQTTQTGQGLTITTGNGTPLVAGSNAYTLTTAAGSNGMTDVMANGQDITASINGGSLGGTLQVRDTALTGLTSQLDTLASQFASAVNTANAAGYDLTGASGSAIFSSSNGGSITAANIQVAITSRSQIAASSDGTTGSAGNLSTLLAVKSTALPSGLTPTDAYAQIVSNVGQQASQATTNNTAANTVLTQLQTQLASVSGVSLDEETANMIRYQMAYQAAAKVISTVDTLANTLIGITTT